MKHHPFDHTSIEDMITYRHWHVGSESYAGGDSLATALFLGWVISGIVRMEEHWYAGTRRVAVMHFDLVRDGETVTMPVLCNPFVDALIAEKGLQITPVGKQRRLQKEIDQEARV